MTRTGIALVEVLLACLLGVLLAGLALGSLVGLQRSVQGQAERAAVHAVLRTSRQVLLGELRSLAPDDVAVLAADRVVYRAGRGAGHSCDHSADGLVFPTGGFQSLRLPDPGRDSLAVLSGTSGPHPVWVRLEVAGPLRSVSCPDGSAAVALPLDPLALLDSVEVGAPVRLFEVMELRGYQSTGEWWLGARSVSAGEAIQPITGPFARAPVFRWVQDSTDASTGIELLLEPAASPHPEAQGGAARTGVASRDSVMLRVRFRNPAG